MSVSTIGVSRETKVKLRAVSVPDYIKTDEQRVLYIIERSTSSNTFRNKLIKKDG